MQVRAHLPTCAVRIIPVVPFHSTHLTTGLNRVSRHRRGAALLNRERCRRSLYCHAEASPSTTEEKQSTATRTASDQALQNGTVELPSGKLTYAAPTGMQKFATSLRLIRALPWRRFKKGSVLVLELGGGITEKRQGRFGDAKSMPQIVSALKKAAYDPRISGIYLKMSPLSAGWAKLQEIRQYIEFFRQSGKFSIAYMAQGGEKEYYVASACEEVYIPESASLSLRGLAVAGTFLRGALEKVGVDPNIKRIGKYKSAGDQLLRRDMSEPQREQLTAILDDLYEGFTQQTAASRGKTAQEVEAMLDRGIYRNEDFVEGGWVSALRYEDEVLRDLEKRTDSKPDKLKAIGLKKYASVSATAFGLVGKKRLAVIRAAGAIVGGSGGSPAGGTITAAELVRQIRLVASNKAFSGLILRVDSPGGDALASDLIWRELRVLAEKKPVIASMGDVAASGGYYLSMAASKIVAEQLTITGSIGVITGKFNLEQLYGKIGYAKELISKGRYAELLADNREFTEEEDEYFSEQAQYAYESFRDKAALSRGMQPEHMQQHAQGRVWSGKRALEVGLVDALGGLSRAVAIAKQQLKIPDSENVALVELSREQMSPLMLLSGGASASFAADIIKVVLSLASEGGVLQLLTHGCRGPSMQMLGLDSGLKPMAIMPDVKVQGASELLH